MINFTKYSKTYLMISLVLVTVSILVAFIFGLKLSRDFTGGSLLEVRYTETERPPLAEVQARLESIDLGKIDFQPKGEANLVLKLRAIKEAEKESLVEYLAPNTGNIELAKFESIGPVIGEELKTKAWQALVLAALFIVIYIAWAFRKVSRPVSSWKFGVSAVITLIHDIVVIFGVFVVLGKFKAVEMDSLFITALLTILGFSVHDTIVVFDRIRENLAKGLGKDFTDCVNISINQTLTRSINTSITTLFVLMAILLLGGDSIFWFVLALVMGIVIGTYSSVFVASQLLLWWYHRGRS